ncbi:MAG TPA: ABC transporter ATP-binding protein [Gemmata sp.]|nr:ABC transporter ATP-binding protein [Gemmata sp.]
MDSTAFSRIRSDFLKAPAEKWGAIVSSVGVALCYLVLLVLLYLFVDLVTWQGRIPEFAQLNPARQQEFAAEWAGRGENDRSNAVKRLTGFEPQLKRVADADVDPPPSPEEWELRWRAGVYLTLRDRVGHEAANSFLPEKAAESIRPAETAGEPPRFGVLSLVVRERKRWTGHLLGWLASWNGWMWRQGADGSANLTYLAGLFILAFSIAVVRGVLLNTLAYLSAAVTIAFVTRLRRAIYLHTYRLGSLAIRTVGPAEVTHLFTKQAEAAGAAVHVTLAATYRYPILVIGLLILILLVNFWLAVSFLLLAALVWVIGGQITAHFRRDARLAARQADTSIALLVESLGILRLVKCFQMERFNQNRVERQLTEFSRSGWRKFRGDALAGPLLGSVSLLASVLLLYLAARSVLAGEFTVAGLAVMAVALVSLGPPIAGWVDARLKLRRGREAAEAISEFLDRRGEATEAADAEYLPLLTTRMEFRNVTLKEPGTELALLEHVSFAVPAGSRVAIVGPDPIQKRSLVYLIPRFLDPTTGEIRIEDKNIRWVTHESLRAQVAVVMQDDLMFTDTVANTIGCGDAQYKLPQIIEAAKLAHAHQFIEKLPYGYETVVGEHGRTLKPGERFRVALARALLRDPNILVIEEPSGPIDEDTLALLDDTLERASHGRTIIFLANRLSTLRSVDRVFLLKDGHLEASGSHRDLWQNNEYYRRLQIIADASSEMSSLKD